MIMDRVYHSIATMKNNTRLVREIQVRLKKRALGDATADADLNRSAQYRYPKLGAMLQSADKQVRSLKKQSTFLGQLAAKTIPNSENLENLSLYHYALFFDNVVAASIVVNSTIMNAKVFSFRQAIGMQ
ncbi:polygalacturonate 4-alpha-galacturonosyltransferase-like protein [Tanacetum coccineum]